MWAVAEVAPDPAGVEQTDAAAFEALWHNPISTLKNAFAQSLIGTVVAHPFLIV